MSESLRLGQEQVAEETQLLRDYLRLFPRIISGSVVLSKVSHILYQIIASARLLRDPDGVQRELEALVAGYRYPLILGELINFYILRNAGREKILNAFHDLWRTFGIDNPKMLSKYISFFMKWDLHTSRGPDFEVEVIEEYLRLDTANRTEVEMRLADECERYDMHEIALKHYIQLIDRVEEKEEILGKILDICVEQKFYENATELFAGYSDIINNEMSLRIRKLEILCESGDLKKAQELLDDRGVTEQYLLDKEPYLYSYVMHMLGREPEVNEILDNLLKKALAVADLEELSVVGEAFYRSGKGDEFRSKVEDSANVKESILFRRRTLQLIEHLQSKYRQES